MFPRPLTARDYLGELLQEQECEGAGRSGDRYFIHPDDQLDMPGAGTSRQQNDQY